MSCASPFHKEKTGLELLSSGAFLPICLKTNFVDAPILHLALNPLAVVFLFAAFLILQDITPFWFTAALVRRTWLADVLYFAWDDRVLPLTAPLLGEVTGTALHEANLFRRVLISLVLVCLVAVGMSLLTSPFSDLQSFYQGWYVLGTSTLTWTLFFLPTLLHGWRRRANASRAS